MLLPNPVPGLVIRYSYLWHREYLEGIEEGQKDRPAAIVAAIHKEAEGQRVLVLPITHQEPYDKRTAIEIPQTVKKRLGLDEDRSWVVISEYNEFLWPGPDLRRITGAPDNSVAYGMLPPSLFAIIKRALLKRFKADAVNPIRRSK
jgi:hypothetical protein